MKIRKLIAYFIIFTLYNCVFNGMMYLHFKNDETLSGQSGLFMAMTMLAVGLHYLSDWTVKELLGEKA